MESPKFADSKGKNVFYWGETASPFTPIYPDPNSDRADLSYRIGEEQIVIEHRRNDVIADREVIFTPGVWSFTWRNISQAMVQELQGYTQLDHFRYYPIGENQVYFNVYVPKANGWKVTVERGGTFTATMLLKEYSLEHTGVFADLNGSSHFFYRSDASFPESGITGATDFTIQAWIKPNLGGNLTIVSKYHDTNNKRMYAFWITSTGLLLVAISSDGADLSLSASVAIIATDGDWQHLVAVYDASAGTIDFYRDGLFIEQVAGAKTSIADKDPNFAVGAWKTTDDPQYYFDGGIYRVDVFNDKRTEAEILASYNDPDEDLSGAGNIIGTWIFNEAAAATAIDNAEGDAGRDLTPYNGGDTTFDNCGRTVGKIPT